MSVIASLAFWSMKVSIMVIPVPFLFEIFFPLSAYFVNKMQGEVVLEQSIQIEMLQRELVVAKIEKTVRQEIIAESGCSRVDDIDYTGQLSRVVQNAVSKELGRYFSKENEDIFNDRITYLANSVVELGDMFYRLENAVWEYSDDSSQDYDATNMIATELNCSRRHVMGEHLMQLSDNYSASVIDFGIDGLFQNTDIMPKPFKEVEDGTWLYGQGPLVASISSDEKKAIAKITAKLKK